MNDTDKTAFSDGMTALGIALGAPVDTAMRATYWKFLHDLEVSEFLRAVAVSGKTMRWFPKPAELRDLAGAGGTSALVAETAAAWDAVMGAKRKHDYTTSVDFGPLVNSVIRSMGGWYWFCDQPRDQLATWVRKRFDELYAALKANPLDANRGAPPRGEFPGEPVRIAIGGAAPPMRQIESAARNGVSDVARVLANAKDANAPGNASGSAR